MSYGYYFMTMFVQFFFSTLPVCVGVLVKRAVRERCSSPKSEAIATIIVKTVLLFNILHYGATPPQTHPNRPNHHPNLGRGWGDDTIYFATVNYLQDLRDHYIPIWTVVIMTTALML